MKNNKHLQTSSEVFIEFQACDCTEVCSGSELLNLLIVWVVHERRERVPVHVEIKALIQRLVGITGGQSAFVTHLWLLADGRHKNIMTRRTTENKNLQKASSTQSSTQSFEQTNKLPVIWNNYLLWNYTS